MKDGDWIKTDDQLPEDGVEVEVMNGPIVQTLVRQGRLWFFPDFSMYVYFTPKVWRPVASPGMKGGK